MAKTPTFINGLYVNARGQYIRANGQFVSPLQVRQIIDDDIVFSAQKIESLARSLQAGHISLFDWRAEMARQIKHLHIANLAAAKGGTQNLTQADYGRIGGILRREYRYLSNFANEISRRRQLIHEAGFAPRAASYAQAARTTFEAVRQKEETRRGAKWARRILHSAEHCASCSAAAARGWVPVRDMVPIGRYECKIFCRCTIEYSHEAHHPHTGSIKDMVLTPLYNVRRPSESRLAELAELVKQTGFPTQPQRVYPEIVGLHWKGRKVAAGDYLPPVEAHYLKHVVKRREWPDGTSLEDYTQSLKRIITDPNSGVFVSQIGSRWHVAFARESGELQGDGGHKWTMVEYRIAIGSWMTGFQNPDIEAYFRDPKRSNGKWLRRLRKRQ